MTGISYLSPVKNVLCEEDNNLDIMESHKLAVDTDTETENLYNTYLCFIFIFYIVILCF